MKLRRLRASAALVCLASLLTACHPPAARGPVTPDLRPLEEGSDREQGAASETVRIDSAKVTIRIERDGSHRRTIDRRYTILAEAALERGWGEVAADWSPWRASRPRLNVEVRTPEGKVVQVDEKHAEESTLGSGDTLLYSDSRRLRMPLPELTVGAQVHEVIEDHTTTPLAPGAAGGWEYVFSNVPLERYELVIELPAEMPFNWKASALPSERVSVKVDGGTRRLRYEVDHLTAAKGTTTFPGPDDPRAPAIFWSTAATWASLGQHYAGVVDERLAKERLEDKARAVVATKDDVPTKVRKITAFVQREVRYVGVELGEGAIRPRAPSEVFSSKYGDCKDQATVIVGMLRALGIDAHVALLQTASGVVHEGVPTLDAFNHAIVYVPRAKGGDLWVDPTNRFAQPGELSDLTEGRLALVTDKKKSALVRTPTTASSANVWRERREFWVPSDGRARAKMTVRAFGIHEQNLRSWYDAPERGTRKAIEEYVKPVFVADELTSFSIGKARELATPFLMTAEVTGSKNAIANDDAAEAIVEFSSLFAVVPSNVADKDIDPAPMFLGHARRAEHEFVVHLPERFEIGELPTNDRLTLGPATLTRTFEKVDATTVRAVGVLDLPKVSLSKDEVVAYREAFQRFTQNGDPVLRFGATAARLEEEGKYKEARGILEHDAHAADATEESKLRYARWLDNHGLNRVARDEFTRISASKVGTKVYAQAAMDLLAFDGFGRFRPKEADQRRVVDALREAFKAAPEDADLPKKLLLLATHTASGRRMLAHPEAVSIVRDVLRSPYGKNKIPRDLAEALVLSGDFAALEPLTEQNQLEDALRPFALIARAHTRGESGVKAMLDRYGLDLAGRQKLCEGAFSIAFILGDERAVDVLATCTKGTTPEMQVFLALSAAPTKLSPREEGARSRLVEAIMQACVTPPATPVRFVDAERPFSDSLASETCASTSSFHPATLRRLVTNQFALRPVREVGRLVEVENVLEETRLLMAPVGDHWEFILQRKSSPYTLAAVLTRLGKNLSAADQRTVLDWFYEGEQPAEGSKLPMSYSIAWQRSHDVALWIDLVVATYDGARAAPLLARAANEKDAFLRSMAIYNALIASDVTNDAKAQREVFAMWPRIDRTVVTGHAEATIEAIDFLRRGDTKGLVAYAADSAKIIDERYAALVQDMLHHMETFEGPAAARRLANDFDSARAVPKTELNNLVWLDQLLHTQDEASSLRRAERFAQAAKSAGALDTLALHQALRGDLRATLTTLRKIGSEFSGSEFTDDRALAFAVLARQLGFRDAALALLEEAATEARVNRDPGVGRFVEDERKLLEKHGN